MKSKLNILSSLILGIALMVACNSGDDPNPTIEPEKEKESDKELVKLIYQSLDGSVEQFSDGLTQLGFHAAGNYPSVNYLSFTKIHPDTIHKYDEQAIVGINYKNDTIALIIYDRYLNNWSDPAAYYRFFSDMIASYDYTDWHGYYEDPTDMNHVIYVLHGYGNDYSTPASNRNELCNLINNDHLHEIGNVQYFMESFIYTTSESLWQGRILLWTDKYTSEENPKVMEGNFKWIKDMHLTFSFDRVQ